jgi:hypothetical protein
MYQSLVFVYLAGVAVGCWRADAPPSRRLGLALLWPLSPIACAVTLTTLVVAAGVLFPLVGVTALAVAGGLWWWLR